MVDEQTGAEVAQPIPEAAPKVEVQQPTVEQLQSKLKELETLHAQDTERITRFKKERTVPTDNRVDMEILNKKLDLMMRSQAGTLSEATGTLEQQLKQIDTEYVQKKQSVVSQAMYAQHAEEVLEGIKETLSEAGVDIESPSVPDEVKKLHERWDEYTKAGKPLTTLVTEASKIAAKRLKGEKPDLAKLKEEVKRDLLEEQKRSGNLTFDKGTPSGVPGSRLDILKRYNQGDRSVKKEDVRKALGL